MKSRSVEWFLVDLQLIVSFLVVEDEGDRKATGWRCLYRQISVAAEERYQPWSQRLRSRVLPTGVAVADLVFKDAGIVRGGRRGEGGEETSKGGWIVTGWGG